MTVYLIYILLKNPIPVKHFDTIKECTEYAKPRNAKTKKYICEVKFK